MRIPDSTPLDSAGATGPGKTSPDKTSLEKTSLDKTSLGKTSQTAPVSASQTAAAATAGSPGQDEVSLSGASQSIRSSAAIREARIAGLTASVQSGQYNPSSAATSRALVSETLARSAGGQ